MHGARYCKFHYLEGRSEHWGHLDRKAFAGKGAKPHYPPDTLVRPKALKLNLHFDWAEERVWGVTTHELEILGRELQEVEFDAMNLDISRVKVGRRTTSFENTGDRLIVPLPRSVRSGRVTVEVTHSVSRPAAGIYFTKPDAHYPDRFQTVWTQGQDEDSKFYFPCFDRPNFKQTTEVILHLPPGMFGLSNGRLVKKSLTAREAMYHYRLNLPYSTYLLSIVAGDFVEHRSRIQGVEVKWYVQPGREKEGQNAFRDTGRILRFFSDYTGFPYPYRHYTQIAVPEFIFGGMENFTVTTQTDLTLHDNRAALDMDSNGLVAHEAAHTWFGNVVTAKSWAHAWLHESFATYFDALYTRESKGRDEFRYQLLEDAETYFGEDAKYRRPIVTNVYREPIDLFDAHLYPGGAVRVHHLRRLAGEDPFKQALSLFLKNHAYGLAETVDFVRCLEEVTRRNFDEWMEQWIYRGGYPTLELKYVWDAKRHLATVDIKQTQKGGKKDEPLLFKLALDLRFFFARGEETFPLLIEKKEETFRFHLKRPPVMLRLDPEFTCPGKKVTLDLSRPLLHAQLKKDPDPIGRIQAADALTRNPSQQDIQLLSARLRQETFWGVGVRIAAALGKIGGDSARDGLIRGLREDDPKKRHGIVRALGEFGDDPQAVKALRKVAAGDPSYRVEAEAVRCLGKVRDRDSRPLLEAALDRPSHNDMVRSAVYQALSELEDPECWPLLTAGAEYGAPRMSRGAAMRAMARIARRHEHLKGPALEHLRRFAKENRGTLAAVFRGKIWAIDALQTLDDLAAVPVLRQVADSAADGRLRRRAEDAVAALFAAAKKPKELKEFRDELDDLTKESKSLRDRLDKVEIKPTSKG
ncbi:MAG: M1 family aminopeptidase [Nitrospinaceae bacterium]